MAILTYDDNFLFFSNGSYDAWIGYDLERAFSHPQLIIEGHNIRYQIH